MQKIGIVTNDDKMFLFFCPGCNSAHYITTEIWTFNGDLEKPTIRNSILVHGSADGQIKKCHSFVTDGRIEFLEDCGHDLAGQTVDLPDWNP